MRARETVVDRLLLRRGRGVRKCGSLQVVEMFFLLALPYVPPFTQALLVGDPIAVGRSTDLEYTQGQPCKLFFLNIIKRKATFRVGNYLSWVVRHTEEHPYDWTHYSV